MEKMKSIARKLDVFFKILQICALIAAIAAGVGVLLIAACFVLQLDPESIGTSYEMLEIGWLELEIAAEYLPDHSLILLGAAVQLALTLALCLLGRSCAGCVRSLLAPMKEGDPFHEKAAGCFRRLALTSIWMGVLGNAAVLSEKWIAFRCFRLTDVMTSDKILSVTPNYEADLTFLAIAAVLMLLAYVFHYGQALQQQADETL